jgi:7-cyano-7-deazaguanine synthase in queuosine biosynthesis
MSIEHDILCGALTKTADVRGPNPLSLALSEQGGLVNLRSEDIRRAMLAEPAARLLDLIEIATYVYCADQAITRGGQGVDSMSSDWRRRFRFHVPVRDLDFWQDAKVRECLTSTLSFVSDDEYQFFFQRSTKPPPFQQYLELAKGEASSTKPEEVVLFSGGLDSTAGAIQEIFTERKSVVLVTHRSHDKFTRDQNDLIKEMKAKAPGEPPFHVAVRVNKAMELGREYTQRSRSFLFSSLAATIAATLGLKRIRFYENGVISLNLPLAGQVVGAKATRTTHPKTLAGYAKLFTLVLGEEFAVENPFLWTTKTDVVQIIRQAGFGGLIRATRSCTHTKEATNLHTHCGSCSQCIDRRFATLAAGAGADDPESIYKVDLLRGARPEGESRILVSSYTETAERFRQMDEMTFLSRYGEIARALKDAPGKPAANLQKAFQLLKRHGEQVMSVLREAHKTSFDEIVGRRLPDSCLLRLAVEPGNTAPAIITPAKPGNGAHHVSIQVRPTYINWDISRMPRNFFVRVGPVSWDFSFEGGPRRTLTEQNGAAFLEHLLTWPNKSFDVEELNNAVRPMPISEVAGSQGELFEQRLSISDNLSGKQPLADSTFVRQVLASMTRLRVEIQAAEDENNSVAADVARKELAKHSKWLRGVVDRDGNLRYFKGTRKKVLDALTRSMERLRKSIGEAFQPFADHLTAALKVGATLRYEPAKPIDWHTTLNFSEKSAVRRQKSNSRPKKSPRTGEGKVRRIKPKKTAS